MLPGEVIEGEAAEGRITQDAGIVTPRTSGRGRPAGITAPVAAALLMHGTGDFLRGWKIGVVEQALRAQLAAPVTGMHVRRRARAGGRCCRDGGRKGARWWVSTPAPSAVITDIADCHVPRPAIQSALPLLRQITVTGASRGRAVAGGDRDARRLDVAVTGGKPMDAALFQALAGAGRSGRSGVADMGRAASPAARPCAAHGARR